LFFKLSYKFDAAILIVLAVGAGYFVYAKGFRQKDCGCGSGKACGSKGKRYDWCVFLPASFYGFLRFIYRAF